MEILIALVVLGLLLYIIQALPIDATVKRIAFAIIIVVVFIWLVRYLWPYITPIFHLR